MSERAQEDVRVEELLRVNEQLAAEVRNLTLGYADAPRPAGMPTARRLGRLIAERDRLEGELESTRRELGAELDSTRRELEAEHAATRAELDLVSRDRAALELQNQEMAAEIARLSAGLSGLLRRARGRLLSR